jgi:hypothetical protein
MSPEIAFILTLLLRMTVTAAFVVAASVITERSVERAQEGCAVRLSFPGSLRAPE